MLELETATATARTLPEEELLAAAAEAASTEGRALERVTLLLLRIIRIITAVEALLEFRIRQNLIGLIDGRHLLLGLLGRHIIRRGLVRVMQFGKSAVCLLDVALVGVAGDAEDFVVVFLF